MCNRNQEGSVNNSLLQVYRWLKALGAAFGIPLSLPPSVYRGHLHDTWYSETLSLPSASTGLEWISCKQASGVSWYASKDHDIDLYGCELPNVPSLR